MKRIGSVLLLISAGCMGPEAHETEIETHPSLPFAEVGRGRNAMVDTVHRVITSREEWTTLQDSLRPLVPFMPVDFELEMVLVAALPVQSGGYDLRFEEVEDLGDTIVARYRLYTPGQDCRHTMGAGNVFQVVRLARTTRLVTFEDTEEALDCTES